MTERVSRAVFRNKHALDVLAAIAARSDDEWLYARMIADVSGVRENQVGAILKRLAAADLLRQMTSGGGGGQKILYDRVDSPLWTLATELHAWTTSKARVNEDAPDSAY